MLFNSIAEISCRIKSATRSERFPSIPTPFLRSRGSNRKDLNLFFYDFGKIHLFNKVNDLVEARIDESAIISNGAEPDLGSLPEVIVSNLGDGHIEPSPDPINQFPDDMTLFLQRMVFRNPKVELTNSNHHLLSPIPPLSEEDQPS
jgi:hypothetical protein